MRKPKATPTPPVVALTRLAAVYNFGAVRGCDLQCEDRDGAVREQVWGNPGGEWPLGGVDEGGLPMLHVAVEGLLVGVVTDGAFAPAATDPSGTLVFVGAEWLGVPDVFGESATAPTTSGFRHVYAGLEVLPGSGGYQLAQHRLYDGGMGRFSSADPIEGDRNRFSYAGNDPGRLWDPTGLSSCDTLVRLPRPEEWFHPAEAVARPANIWGTRDASYASASAAVAWMDAAPGGWGPPGPVGGPWAGTGPEGPGDDGE
jgi:RHS repeat-associated protein